MTELILTSAQERPFKALVEAALHNEMRLLQASIRRTEKAIRSFEARYDLSSDTFLQQYENDNLPETLEFVEWIGEYRMLQRLREKVETLKGIHIAN